MFESSRISFAAAWVIATIISPNSSAMQGTDRVLAGASPAQIAFASNHEGNWEIYVTDADGQHQTRLTRREPQDRFPLWSPDRTQIAFGSQVGGDHWELWVMNADGSNPRFLATQIVAKASREWSHDGKRIVFTANVGGDVDIFSVSVASGQLVRLTNSPGEDRDPSLSPDDGQLTFSSERDGNSEVYVMRSDGTNPRRLTNHGALDRSPVWSPDGTRIAFVSTRDGDKDAYTIRVDNGKLERLTTSAHVTNDGAQWSPSGAYLAVQSSDRNYDIQLVRVADRQTRTIAGSPAYDGQVSWSPTDDRLAFISGRDGFNAVYITDLVGTPRRVTSAASLDPEWR